MPKIDKSKVAQLIDEINDKHGDGSIYYLGDDENLDIERTDTGIKDLNWLMGGGLPQGRIIELYGKYSGGKTSLCHYLQSKYDLALHIDIEGAFSSERAELFGNEQGQLLIRKPKSGEEALSLVIKACEAGMPLIVVDSVPSLIPKKYIEEDDLESDRFAAVAGLLSRWIFKIASKAEDSGSTVIFINQIRDKMGGSPWDPHKTPGGHALEHYSSLRIQMNRKKWIKVSGDAEGQICRLRTYKSKVCAPYRTIEIPLIFEKHGFISGGESEAKELIYDLRRERRKEQDDDNE